MSIGREDYQARRDARVERLENRADRARWSSAAASHAAHEIMSAIPPGQPILVGHHSEARHRRDLDKIDRKIRQSIQADEKAAYYQERAESAASNTAISSDDPDALDKLEDKISRLQAAQEHDKAINAWYRKHKTMQGFPGITDEEAARVDAELAQQDASPYSTGTHPPVPSCRLSNRNAEINRLKKRVEALRRVDKMEHVEISFDGGAIVTNEDVNRVQILFDEKPDEATRSKLKQNGFRWSPRESAWQAQRTPVYLRRACYLLGVELPTKPAPDPEPDDFSDISGEAIRQELERRATEGSPFVERVMADAERIAAQETRQDGPAYAPDGQALFPLA